MRKMRIALAALAVMLLLLSTTVSGTVAYLSDVREVTNEFSFGDVKVTLTEAQWTAEGGGPRTLTPGTHVVKDPVVENAGQSPCYVRVTVAIGDTGLGNGQNILEYITMDAHGAGWQPEGGQTWGGQVVTLYYTGGANGGILQPGESTEAVFNGFTLNAVANGQSLLQEANNGFSIVVTVQAVQTTVDGAVAATPQAAFAAYP